MWQLYNVSLKVKGEQCQWIKGRVLYLGHWIGQEDNQPSDVRVAPIKNWPVPIIKDQVLIFLRLIDHFKELIYDYSEMVLPIKKLLKRQKTVMINWTQEGQDVFVVLKHRLLDEPVMKLPDIDMPFVLQTNFSGVGLCAVLLQKGDDGISHPVAYGISELKPHEKNYCKHEKAAYAVLWTTRLFEPYLEANKFTLQTHTCALSWLNRMKSHDQKLLRWYNMLQEYDFVLQQLPKGRQSC